MGSREQRKRVYMPRSLARFRQGFGRLMRRESDKGCVFLLDKRVIEPRHRAFLKELPLAGVGGALDAGQPAAEPERLARLVRGETDLVLDKAFAHMGMLPDIERRGLDTPFTERVPRATAPDDFDVPPPHDPEPPTDAPSIFFPTEEPPF